MDVKLWNTMGREMQTFVPIEQGKVGMYCCGLTVYDFAHVGNLRTYVLEDILRKTLEYFGYTVRHVMNITDVGHLTGDADEGEDKMLKGAREKGKTVWEIADFYTKAFFRDFGAAPLRHPTVVCKATEHIQDMIDLIRRIEAKGFTYVAGGNVYFDIAQVPRLREARPAGPAGPEGGRPGRGGRRARRTPPTSSLWFTKGRSSSTRRCSGIPPGAGDTRDGTSSAAQCP